MIYQAGDLNVLFDSGNNNPGDILQRRESTGWQDFKVNGVAVEHPVDVNELPPGEYRLVPIRN